MKPQLQCGHDGEPCQTPYHYTECGLDDVFLLSGYDIEEGPDYGETVSVRHADELHAVIGQFLVYTRKILSGKELRFLRREMDLTQAELGVLVGLTDQAVARWENDKTEITGPADHMVRVLFMEHANRLNGFEVRRLLEELEERDAQRDDVKQTFEQSNGKWQSVALAA